MIYYLLLNGERIAISADVIPRVGEHIDSSKGGGVVQYVLHMINMSTEPPSTEITIHLKP